MTFSPGGRVVYVGETRLPFGQEPLLLYGGGLTLQTSSGSVQAILLDTHSFMTSDAPTSSEQVQLHFQKLIFQLCSLDYNYLLIILTMTSPCNIIILLLKLVDIIPYLL